MCVCEHHRELRELLQRAASREYSVRSVRTADDELALVRRLPAEPRLLTTCLAQMLGTATRFASQQSPGSVRRRTMASCWVVREEYSAALCERQVANLTADPEMLGEATVTRAVAVELLTLPQLLEIGATLYMRGRWARQPTFSLQLTSANGSAIYSVIFAWLTRRTFVEAAPSGATEAGAAVVASSDLVVWSDAEAFDLDIHFEWKRLKG